MNVNEFLKKAEVSTVKCSFCKDARLKAAIEAFLLKKSVDETHISLNYFFENYLVAELGAPKNDRALSRHVKQCMNRDVRTGKILNEK